MTSQTLTKERIKGDLLLGMKALVKVRAAKLIPTLLEEGYSWKELEEMSIPQVAFDCNLAELEQVLTVQQNHELYAYLRDQVWDEVTSEFLKTKARRKKTN